MEETAVALHWRCWCRKRLPGRRDQRVTGYGNEVGRALCEHPDVAKISFTGSPGAGGESAHRRCVVQARASELGGRARLCLTRPPSTTPCAAVRSVFRRPGSGVAAGSRPWCSAASLTVRPALAEAAQAETWAILASRGYRWARWPRRRNPSRQPLHPTGYNRGATLLAGGVGPGAGPLRGRDLRQRPQRMDIARDENLRARRHADHVRQRRRSDRPGQRQLRPRGHGLDPRPGPGAPVAAAVKAGAVGSTAGAPWTPICPGAASRPAASGVKAGLAARWPTPRRKSSPCCCRAERTCCPDRATLQR